jgi:hypothetical protein
VKLSWNDDVLASADGVPPLTSMPQDSLEVGRDENGLVGPYSEDNIFSGKLGTITIDILP